MVVSSDSGKNKWCNHIKPVLTALKLDHLWHDHSSINAGSAKLVKDQYWASVDATRLQTSPGSLHQEYVDRLSITLVDIYKNLQSTSRLLAQPHPL